ncbi:PaaI family thioesterase [Rhodospirillaceae bacterium KN72]|uniref:PaaI family thioesterase n=1 Tax=Pacificispira spongiicola TaxID=2729598 RepID=A0A7Y0E290_9PROT|nr:PaaI family thioesterase [Pacificispira spongiicola]NMM45828.1 PaaI family thioesterase [Pacificispira spongiicola]
MAIDLEAAKKLSENSLVSHLGIEMLKAGDGLARARMKVTKLHLAPNGYLHAASIVGLADTCCGFGTYADLPDGAQGFTTVELKSNHLGTALKGTLVCHAHAKHQGRTTQVWDAEVFSEARPDRPIALFRCTQMILWPKGG